MVAEMAMKLATGKSLVVPAEIDNKARMIPMAVAEIHNVTKENMMETIIAEHFHSFDEVYKTIPENERPTRP